ncbi:MAG: hypothetical protein ABS81_22120 [Pseudonocardia sp. SCN 72-86]|nr:MAG: hypothetical protein ABS81_22120 [Pseudonocardia sp. SCN 72-86]
MPARAVDHEAEVLEVQQLSPSFVRVELGGDDLRAWRTLGVPDESCLFRFPGDEARAAGGERTGRWYTVRTFDAAHGRMGVDLLVHPGGFGGEWAAGAAVGDRLRIRRQDSWYRRPDDVRWQLLVGDVVSLPAFARIVEETRAGCPTRAAVELADPADRRPLPGADVTWLYNTRMPAGESVLVTAVRDIALPTGPGYVYVAGEGAATRAVRALLRQERALPRDSCTAVGYWQATASG